MFLVFYAFSYGKFGNFFWKHFICIRDNYSSGILATFKKKYGQAVLAEPPKGGFSAFILYGVPFGLVLIGLLVMTVIIARRRDEDAEDTEITIPDDFDSQRQVLAVGSCTPESLSDIFIAAYKRIGEVDGQETYQRFAYVSDSDNFGCSNAGQYPNNMKSCLGSYILVNDSGTYTDPNGDGPIIADNKPVMVNC